jgi:autotransporter-associated beta strand protein
LHDFSGGEAACFYLLVVGLGVPGTACVTRTSRRSARARFRAALIETTALVAIATGMIAWPGLSHAQVFTWQTGPIDPTDYNDSTNWTPAGGAPSFPGQSALFGAGGSPNVVVNTAVAPDSWTFNAASQNYIIFGDTVTFSRPASAGGGIVNLANNGASLIVANDLNGVGGVLQNGNSTLMLFGAANSFTGATVVLAGTLAAGNVNAFSFQSAHFVNAGATDRQQRLHGHRLAF